MKQGEAEELMNLQENIIATLEGVERRADWLHADPLAETRR